MYIPLAIPSRNLLNLLLCTMGAYVMTICTFPPHDPPPFPIIIFGDNKEDKISKTDNQ